MPEIKRRAIMRHGDGGDGAVTGKRRSKESDEEARWKGGRRREGTKGATVEDKAGQDRRGDEFLMRENRREAGEESDRRQTKRRSDGQADRRTNGRAGGAGERTGERAVRQKDEERRRAKGGFAL